VNQQPLQQQYPPHLVPQQRLSPQLMPQVNQQVNQQPTQHMQLPPQLMPQQRLAPQLIPQVNQQVNQQYPQSDQQGSVQRNYPPPGMGLMNRQRDKQQFQQMQNMPSRVQYPNQSAELGSHFQEQRDQSFQREQFSEQSYSSWQSPSPQSQEVPNSYQNASSYSTERHPPPPGMGLMHHQREDNFQRQQKANYVNPSSQHPPYKVYSQPLQSPQPYPVAPPSPSSKSTLPPGFRAAPSFVKEPTGQSDSDSVAPPSPSTEARQNSYVIPAKRRQQNTGSAPPGFSPQL